MPKSPPNFSLLYERTGQMASIISDQICEQLAADVVNGTIPPGRKLEEQVIADQFGVSRTPVREAFRQLAAAGLIDTRPHRGVTVINLDISQLSDMFEALAELEAMCAAMSAERMTSIERKQLEAIHESIRPLVSDNDVSAYSPLNEQLHDVIRKGAHNHTLAASTRRLRHRLAPFRQPSWAYKKRDRLSASFSEHEELVGAILAGDRQRAHDAARDHTNNNSVLTIEFLSATNQA